MVVGVHSVDPRDVGLRFAISKALEGFLPLVCRSRIDRDRAYWPTMSDACFGFLVGLVTAVVVTAFAILLYL
jgi:hypothetical protein